MPKIRLPLKNFLSHLSKRERFIFYVVILFVSLALLDCLILRPIYSKIGSLNREIKEKSASIRTSTHILAQKDRILAQSEKYSSFLSTVQSEDEMATSVLKELEGLANKSSVYIIDMKPGGFKSASSSKRLVINLNCEAQMEQLIEFMFRIENSSELLTIDRYEMSPKSKESSVVKCSMSVSKISM